MDVRQTYATIDLGDVSVPEREPGPQRGTAQPRRGLVAAALVLAVTFGAAPSERGAPYLGNPLWTVAASLAGFAVGSTVVILSEPSAATVIGRDLRTGETRWTLAVTSPPESISELSDGVAAVIIRDTSRAGTGPGDAVVTLLLTYGGTVLDRIPGAALMPINVGPYLLVGTEQQVAAGCPADDSCTELSTFDIKAERPLSRMVLTGDLIASVADPGTGVRRVATMRHDGVVVIHDPATGGTVGRYLLPGGHHSGHLEGGFWPPALLVGDTLVVAVRRDRNAELTAYSVGPGGHTWTASLPVSPALTATTAQFYIAGCGRMLCLHTDGADAVFAPESGMLRAQVGVQVVGQLGDVLLAVPSAERPGNYRPRRTVLLYSATDGRRLATLPDTVIVPWRDAGSRVMLARRSGASSDVSVLEATGDSRLLGTVTGADLTCAAASGLLLCADPLGSVRAWRLP